jgi:hypothetical protein
LIRIRIFTADNTVRTEQKRNSIRYKLKILKKTTDITELKNLRQ